MNHSQQVTPLKTIRRIELGALVVSEFLQPKGLEIPKHSHDFAVLTLPLSGQSRERIENHDFLLEPGTLTFKPEGIPHTHSYPSNFRCILIQAFDTDQNRVAQWSGKKVASLRRELQLELRVQDQSSELALVEISRRALSLFGCDKFPICPAPPKWLSRTKDYLTDNFRERVSLSEIAKVAGVHETHLAETFHRYFRCTIGEFLRRLRLDRALEEITGSEKSLAEIAIAAGFYDQSHFHRFFKRYVGLTPAIARRLKMEAHA